MYIYLLFTFRCVGRFKNVYCEHIFGAAMLKLKKKKKSSPLTERPKRVTAVLDL